jgi:hypothetical protein
MWFNRSAGVPKDRSEGAVPPLPAVAGFLPTVPEAAVPLVDPAAEPVELRVRLAALFVVRVVLVLLVEV